MSNFSSLKAAIQQYIKTNGNEEITGAVLQDILLSMVSVLGDTAINDLETALHTETTNRTNADGTLLGDINAVSNRVTAVEGAITAINTKLAEGYVYAGIATPSTDPSTPTGKVFYIALQGGTYSNFNGLVVDQGINILKYNGSTWSLENIYGVDDVPTAESNNLVKSGGIYNQIVEKMQIPCTKFLYQNKYINTRNVSVDDKIDLYHLRFVTLQNSYCDIFYVNAGSQIKLLGWGLAVDTSKAIIVDFDGLVKETITVASADTVLNISESGLLIISTYNPSSPDAVIELSNVQPIVHFSMPVLDRIWQIASERFNIDFTDLLFEGKYYDSHNVGSTISPVPSGVWNGSYAGYIPVKKGMIINLNNFRHISTSVKQYICDTDFVVVNVISSTVAESTEIININQDGYVCLSLLGGNVSGFDSDYYNSRLKQIKEYFTVIPFKKFTFIDRYVSTVRFNVGDYIPDVSRKLSSMSGINTLVLPLTKGNRIIIDNIHIASDIKYLLVLNRDTRKVIQKIELTNDVEFSYTATEDSIILCSIWSDSCIVKTDEDYQLSIRESLADKKIVAFNYGNGSFFDYSVALKMDKGLLKNVVETASNGKCTVIFDNNGYPSLMRKIPLVSIGALNSYLGGNNEPHPAFIVNGAQKQYIYVAVFMNSTYNGVPVSWWGLPAERYGSHVEVKAACAAKGSGWHMETIWERSLISLLSGKFHNNAPRGNTHNGQSSVQGYEYEYVQLVHGSNTDIPGQVEHSRSWYNGTEPDSWSHDNSPFGIFDIIGGYHERCDLLKLDNGKVYLNLDNTFGVGESEWTDTGVYLNHQNNTIVVDNVDSAQHTGELISKVWSQIEVNQGYNNISEAIRKKICLALIIPYLSNDLSVKVYDFNPDGGIWIKDDIVAYPFLGGAAGYSGSSLGMNILSYDKEEDHGNIGTRLCYID